MKILHWLAQLLIRARLSWAMQRLKVRFCILVLH